MDQDLAGTSGSVVILSHEIRVLCLSPRLDLDLLGHHGPAPLADGRSWAPREGSLVPGVRLRRSLERPGMSWPFDPLDPPREFHQAEWFGTPVSWVDVGLCFIVFQCSSCLVWISKRGESTESLRSVMNPWKLVNPFGAPPASPTSASLVARCGDSLAGRPAHVPVGRSQLCWSFSWATHLGPCIVGALAWTSDLKEVACSQKPHRRDLDLLKELIFSRDIPDWDYVNHVFPSPGLQEDTQQNSQRTKNRPRKTANSSCRFCGG